MKGKNQLRFALIGILCLLMGGAWSFYASRRYSEKRYVVDAASCRMNLVVVERKDLPPSSETGSVVLFHGISANENIMQYLARAFAELGLRVFLPDLPGHGRSPGPFTPELAESCSVSLVRGLAARGMLVPERTILAGHSMGAAIALRIAQRVRPAGVIAISPAPMKPAHGAIPENLLFHDVPILPPNTRILVGQFDITALTENARDLVPDNSGPVPPFKVIPWNTHVSMLFSPAVAMDSQAWASLVLALPEATRLPSRGNLFGCLVGFVGILLLAGPCIRDLVGKEQRTDPVSTPPRRYRGALEIAIFSLFAIYLLGYWQPLRFLRLFQGAYLAGFFLVVGVGLILLHLRETRVQWPVSPGLLVGAALAAILFYFLAAGWFELTATSAWLTAQRWERFPVFLVAAFLFFFGLELLSGPAENWRARYAYWLLLVVVAWSTLSFGVLHLKSGEFLLVLLSPYFALQFILSGMGVQLVRQLTGSATAAAVFGAILLTGFSLVLFPVS